MKKKTYYTHSTAEVSKKASIGRGAKIWNHVQIRENVRVGEGTIISKNVYIGENVQIGKYCRIQNNCSIYRGVTLEDFVFLGPHVVFTNHKIPRAINPSGKPITPSDWNVGKIVVQYGASIGAHSVLLPNISIGRYAIIGAGSVVTKSIGDFVLAYGNPAKKHGFVCICGRKIRIRGKRSTCVCGKEYKKVRNAINLLHN